MPPHKCSGMRVTMKLLIVDDEKLTRDGLMNSIDWKSLGIHAVAQADDGLHGYETALAFHPDIILSDVRMPRMSGIEMAEKLQLVNPDLSIIFMSGYSDKEYLKAAIKLKAVSYVEKPIDLEEISESVLEAKNAVEAGRKAASSKALSLARSRAALAARLASAPKGDTASFLTEELDFDFPQDETTAFFTVLIQFHHNTYSQDALTAIMESVVARVLDRLHLKEIHSTRQGLLYFYHVWGFSDYTANQKNNLGGLLEQALAPLSLRHHIIFGKNVNGALHIHDSYNSAVIELQNSFFQPYNTYRIYEHRDTYDTFFDVSTLNMDNRLSEALLRKDKKQTDLLLEELFEAIMPPRNVLPNQAKDLYYKLFTMINDTCEMLNLPGFAAKEPGDSLWGYISECESIYELQDLLVQKAEQFFSQIQNRSENSSTVYLIKEFIAGRYQDETLSIKDISEHVFLSSSYVCTLFKNETGRTLNQYLTDFRIDKAKNLLADPRYKITDISARVGYSDGNYFGKTFKKLVGMSPSEYREQELHLS